MADVELLPWQKELATWVENYKQEKNLSFAAVARHLGFPEGTLDDWRRRKPKELERMDPVSRMQLYEKTGIETLKVEGYVPKPRDAAVASAIPGEDKHARELQSLKRKYGDIAIENITDGFYLLVEMMEPLKMDESLRKELVKRIPESDAKYLVALLNGTYAPGGRDGWVMSYSIPPRKRR